jgi:vitamin B12 transporter
MEEQMSSLLLLLAAASAANHADPGIVITASRLPVEKAETPASVNILDGETLAQLGMPLTSDAIRLLPGVSVATSGPPGSQSQLRIRGAEANHTLLFVDGIRFNDPAAGNEARFELLTSDSLSRLELIRGPQSALWGSEALGGVVAVTTADPSQGNALSARAEYGSHDTARLSGQGSYRTGDLGVSASGGWIRSDGIDAMGDHGDRDGFFNRSASLKAVYTPSKATEIGIVGHWIDSKTEFDGSDPITFLHADTLDSTRNRMLAGRTWLNTSWGADQSWSLNVDASLLGSRNRNFLADEPLNQTYGRRFTASAQLAKTFEVAGTEQHLIAATEYQREHFRARDQEFFGLTNQSRSRNLLAFIGEWRADWSKQLSSDVAIRHDRFSDFNDATTLRASLLFRPAEHWTLHAAYGEGIAQPTFYDLFGFFPGFFTGNADLKPESGNNWEAGVRWSQGPTSIGITAYRARLHDEIVVVFFPVSTAINAIGTSRRRGIEVEAAHQLSNHFTIQANYSFLDADEPDTSGAPVREVRRAKHSANLFATGSWGPLRAAASIAYVGKRFDTNFDAFPAQRVILDDYVLASLDVGWELSKGVEAYARVENVFNADYQDAFGYATPGRTVHAGLRLRLGS